LTRPLPASPAPARWHCHRRRLVHRDDDVDEQSTRRLPNVYAELGTTMASMIVTFPTVWAHLIGQLLYYMGENNIVFGSDSMWYGGPQRQIEALWRFQIPDKYRRALELPGADTHEPPRPPAVAGGHGTGQDAGSCRQRELGAPLR
jgi:glyoxylase-like metal-dependent hydrolase (beta-lactamase superfamily II)